MIPLYAIGAFPAFTLSQAGMVRHWMKYKDEAASRHQDVPERAGRAVATGITLLVVLVAKFTSGAWMTAILVPLLIAMMLAIKRHYAECGGGGRRSDAAEHGMNLELLIVVIPMARWNKISEKALRFRHDDEHQCEGGARRFATTAMRWTRCGTTWSRHRCARPVCQSRS